MRGLSTELNLRFKIDWASLIVGSKLTVFALFYFVFEGTYPSTRMGDLTERFLSYRFGGLYLEGLIHGGAYFQNFTVSRPKMTSDEIVLEKPMVIKLFFLPVLVYRKSLFIISKILQCV